MHARKTISTAKRLTAMRRKQVNIRLEVALYQTLQALAGKIDDRCRKRRCISSKLDCDNG